MNPHEETTAALARWARLHPEAGTDFALVDAALNTEQRGALFRVMGMLEAEAYNLGVRVGAIATRPVTSVN